MTPPLTFTPRIAELLAAHAPVAIGVSGGKDSCAAALATVAHLDTIGHAGPRMLVHSDLGRVEWRDSHPTCERLAAVTGLELVTVRRGAGDMMDRWLSRWSGNVRRYADLSCVKLILPWSTPSMRFCTSELKTAVICRELIRRYPGREIVSVSGVRRDESPKRKLALVAKPQKKLTSRKYDTSGHDWNAIIDWSTDEVYRYLAAQGFTLHEAYTRYGMSRVSCAFCIMSKVDDLVASAACADNVPIYREMVGLEIASTFAFQGSRWLADVAPQHLGADELAAVAAAKVRAERRAAIEARIPDHLLYEKGWPKVMPTAAEAELLCEVRLEVARLVGGIPLRHTTPAAILARYRELMAERDRKRAAVQVDEDDDEAAA